MNANHCRGLSILFNVIVNQSLNFVLLSYNDEFTVTYSEYFIHVDLISFICFSSENVFFLCHFSCRTQHSDESVCFYFGSLTSESCTNFSFEYLWIISIDWGCFLCSLINPNGLIKVFSYHVINAMLPKSAYMMSFNSGAGPKLS